MEGTDAAQERETSAAVVWRRVRHLSRALAAVPTSLSSYSLMVVLLATVCAKSCSVNSSTYGGPYLSESIGACAADSLVYPLLGLLLAAGERTRRWLAYLTYPLSVLAVIVALINAAYLAIANDQIDARVLSVGMNRFDEVADIALLEALSRAGRVGAIALLALPLGFLVIRAAWARARLSAQEIGRLRLEGLTSLCVLGGVSFVVAYAAGWPHTLSAHLIADNALVHTYSTWLETAFSPVEEYAGALEHHFEPPMVARGAMRGVEQRTTAPDVLMLVLESTRFDHVQQPIPGLAARARTPALLALAERGTFFTNAHASMPHTSKSLVSLLCGRLPAMENPVLEAADGVLRECLPELLRSAGYATAFMQSAIGSFEHRPRLSVRLGYESFAAFETIDAPPLGYLSGDDRALAPALQKWLQTVGPRRRFFATLLTSGTHHPYQLPPDVHVQDEQEAGSRYAALVELEDQVLAAIIEVLRQAGRLDNTIIVAVADHGEGLPGDAVRQHDNNFFDESLHVPMILAGPGVAVSRNQELTSLLDVAPMLLGTIGVDTTLPDSPLRFGRNLLRAGVRREQAPFACWNDGMCEGFITRDAKVARLITDHRLVAFDRNGYVEEKAFRSPTPAELQVLDLLERELALTRLVGARSLLAEPIALPSGFSCGPGASECIHPGRPRGGFHALSR